MTDLTAAFHAGPQQRRRLWAAAGASLLLGAAAFPLEWPMALAGGLLGTAFGLACAARKEEGRGPVIELTPHAVLYRGELIARWRDVDHVDLAVRKDRGSSRHVLTVREFSRGDARPDIHRLDISEVAEPQRDEVLRLSKELAQRALTDELLLRRHSPAGMLRHAHSQA